MENTRQQKIAKQIQRDIAEIFQRDLSATLRGTLVTVTTVRVSPDLAYAKIYISIFPYEKAAATLDVIESQNRAIRGALGNGCAIRSSRFRSCSSSSTTRWNISRTSIRC